MPRGIRKEPLQIICAFCGEPGETLSNKAAYCSTKCAANGRKRKRAHDLPRRMADLSNGAKYRANRKSIPHNIDGPYLLQLWDDQGGKCAITGEPFDLSYGEGLQKGWSKHDAPSLDRIIPELGYVIGNVRLTTFQVNCAMGVYTDEQFYKMCELALARRISQE